jgi:phytoene synthase
LADPPAGNDREDLDELIRRVDPDRWLTSRFISDRAARADVIALYAYDHELARARRVGSTALMAEIRLAWWREALDEIFEGRSVRRHPTALALAAAIQRHGLPRAPLERMIDGQIEALEEASLDAAAAIAWADATQGSVAMLAAQILGASDPERACPAGRAWGLALVSRAKLAALTVLAGPLRQTLADASTAARSLSVSALPAALPARLARFDLADAQPGPLAKRLSLLAASLTGRI